VRDDGDPVALTLAEPRFDCDPNLLTSLGLSLKPGIDQGDFIEAANEARIPSDCLSLVVVSEDATLKRRDLLVNQAVLAMDDVVEIVKYRDRKRPRSMLNVSEGLSLTVSLVLARELEPLEGRPRRTGTRIAEVDFRIKGYADASSLEPLKLTQEVINKYELSPKTMIFVATSENLLEADSLSNAVSIYVHGDVLSAIGKRRRGPEYDYVAGELAVNAMQQVVYLLSAELNAGGSPSWTDEPAVLSFIREKLNSLRPKAMGPLEVNAMVDELKERPHVVASWLTTVRQSAKSAEALLGQPQAEES
jgi:hypothetical protein